jgi:hypothetical protein
MTRSTLNTSRAKIANRKTRLHSFSAQHLNIITKTQNEIISSGLDHGIPPTAGLSFLLPIFFNFNATSSHHTLDGFCSVKTGPFVWTRNISYLLFGPFELANRPGSFGFFHGSNGYG